MFALTACAVEHEHEHEHEHVPDEYAELENPYRGDRGVSVAGRGVYASLCAGCHGIDGAGDGPRARDMNPPPADLLALVDDASVTDGYVYWRIAEGGQADGTQMPAWSSRLDAPETWSVITYLQCQVAACRAWRGEEVSR